MKLLHSLKQFKKFPRYSVVTEMGGIVWRSEKEGIYVGIRIADSLCCTSETNTAL